MAIFKCKMCGGTIEFEPGATVGICDSCGTKQTLPKLNDDRRANLYDRANHFRRNNDFDRAAGFYEQILNEDDSDAEAYWSLVLCRYGIEYVEDPGTHRRVPTINRSQFTSIFDDDNYKLALQNADGYQRELYEKEAKEINEIQKGILAISQKEEPFDVFICYKESDNNGRRTPDSVLANDLYHQLTQEGFKVFFARITLEDKLGTAYEPYIFAALNSAKVMVVLGTRPEYFNAVWVRNEWSRYLSLVKASNGKKVLIPAYRDMDPYDLPDEFSHLQAQDMSKLGFMQDLIRGITKIVNDNTDKTIKKEVITTNAVSSNTAPLLRRAFLFLEDGKWKEADEYCEKVLDLEPENAQAYIGKLMADLKVRKQEELSNCEEPFDNNDNYQKAIRFGSDSFSSEIKGYIAFINERNENNRRNEIYSNAVRTMSIAYNEGSYKTAAKSFESIPGFKDSDTLAEQCLEKAELLRKEAAYASAKSNMARGNSVGYSSALSSLRSICGWKDADDLAAVCQQRIDEIKRKEEADRIKREREEEEARLAREKAKNRRSRIKAFALAFVLACACFYVLLTQFILPNQKYNSAIELYKAGKYEEAIAAFTALDGYKDSAAKIEEIKPQYYKELLSTADAGSTVYFGSYEQDNNTSNGKEDIEWIVLAKEGNKVLIISKYALDCQKYSNTTASVTWRTCSLRKWLNETFLNKAFSEDEQAKILEVTVSADKNPNYKTSPGKNTTDQVFLLSITEVEKYFSNDSTLVCQGTEYCYAQGAESAEGNCWWWLRTPGHNSDTAAVVLYGGFVYFSGEYICDKDGAVRPALWIDLAP